MTIEPKPLEGKLIPLRTPHIDIHSEMDKEMFKQIKGFYRHDHVDAAVKWLYNAIKKVKHEKDPLYRRCVLAAIELAFPDIWELVEEK